MRSPNFSDKILMAPIHSPLKSITVLYLIYILNTAYRYFEDAMQFNRLVTILKVNFTK